MGKVAARAVAETEITAADGAHLSDKDAVVVTRELRRLAAAHEGRIEPAAVVEAARSPRSPLHRHFEWDDTEAATQYRLEQARCLIRSVRVTLDTPSGPLVVRPFVHTPERDAYCETGEVMRAKELREALVARALDELHAWQARYRAFAELASIHEALESVLAKRKAG